MAENIKLGLDLKGGSRLVLQVQVQDAAKVEAQQTIERIKDDLRKANIDFASMENNEPASVDTADSIQIDIKGIPAAKSKEFRTLMADHFGHLDPDRGEFHRLPHEYAALRSCWC